MTGRWIPVILGAVLIVAASPEQQEITGPQLIENLASKTFTGKVVDLECADCDLEEVFLRLESISGLSIELDQELRLQEASKVRRTYAVKGVPWDKALEIILNGNELGLRLDGEKLVVQRMKPERSTGIPSSTCSAWPIDFPCLLMCFPGSSIPRGDDPSPIS